MPTDPLDPFRTHLEEEEDRDPATRHVPRKVAETHAGTSSLRLTYGSVGLLQEDKTRGLTDLKKSSPAHPPPVHVHPSLSERGPVLCCLLSKFCDLVASRAE